MHIEPGILSAMKVGAANTVAVAMLVPMAIHCTRKPWLLVRACLAAGFFTLAMQIFHLKVGPSELHFVAAMPIYLTLGVVPTLLGFAGGLLLQGALFEPVDLVHLGVNTLSLAIPLLIVHFALGARIQRLRLRDVLRLDGTYYAGLTLMVGFWLSLSDTLTPLSEWVRFASSYLTVVVFEPFVTVAMLSVLGHLRGHPIVQSCFDLHPAA
ncbi:cobalt transport protein CbiM [Variovorax sp. SRS16]|uniref:energy-coupling factor ABC transporter permease n=1 Tax=Variovorax sp. SRS16 TaxID=282217 RepID=UPI0013184BEE|nr:energy-coupling factor ABC transporter permease [Variovorax sp. SRS16]VTU31161.1 cobalt transport protein CbiM [Variovorax sp. SRS16]